MATTSQSDKAIFYDDGVLHLLESLTKCFIPCMGSWKQYTAANDILNETLLTGRYEGRPLYLSLESSVRDDIARKLVIDPDDVEHTIASIVGNSLSPHGDPYEEHLKIARHWWTGKRNAPPPFTAVLVALSYAASLMAADSDFGGGNYYDRLGQALDFPPEALRFHGNSTYTFWRMFNRWLTENDYDFGRPTARQFNALKYVNYPQSQAIVRAGDRHLFHDLFETYGLSGSDDLSIEEIHAYLANWIFSSASNDRLRAAWAKPELRERVCEVALAELQDWSSGSGQGDQKSAGQWIRLTLAVSLVPQFPKARFSLLLGRKGEVSVPIDGLKTEDGRFEASLRNEVYGSFATVSPNPLTAFSGVMDEGLKLVKTGEESGISWQPRSVIPYAQSSEGPYWIEISRVGLGSEHMVLVRDIPRLRNKVDSYLAASSTGEAQLATSKTLDGLPAGWVLYNKVIIIKPAEEGADGLEAISPLQEEGGIQLVGGLQLARGVWHGQKPPRIHFLASTPPSSLLVYTMGDEEEEIGSFPGEGRAVVISPNELSALGDGEYTVKPGRAGNASPAATVILRSASRPRPLNRQGKGRLIYEAAVSATMAGATLPPSYVEGLSIHLSNDNLNLPEVSLHELQVPTGEVESAVVETSIAVTRETRRQSCVERGYHYYICETLPPGAPKRTPLRMTCKDCGQSVLLKDRGKKPKKAKSKEKPAKVEWAPLVATTPPAVDHDLLLDAFCFLGSGSLSRLEALLSSWIEEPWQLGALASDYSSLGFLDLSFKGGSGRIAAWSVPAAAICFVQPQRAFLTGFRSSDLETEIRDAVEAAGGAVTVSKEEGRPSNVQLEGLGAAEVKQAMESIHDPLGRSVGVFQDIAQDLASACIQLGHVGGILQPIAPGIEGRLKKFDCRSARWGDARNHRDPGAYRLDFGGTTYFYRQPDGNAVRGPHQLVKLLAARGEGVSLHSYDSGRRCFVSTLGAEPLGLLARALVCSSGNLPSRGKGTTSYHDVPATVAAKILHVLYKEPV